MQFRQLEYFAAVARERHFARAAEACYVSQPALSASIAKLERELGVTLINRDHNFEGLTAEGERLAVWARRILAEKDGFKTELAAVRSGISGTLRLGVEPTASTSVAQPVARPSWLPFSPASAGHFDSAWNPPRRPASPSPSPRFVPRTRSQEFVSNPGCRHQNSVADYGSSSSTRRSLTLTTTTTRACTSCRCMKNGTSLWPLTSD